MRPDILILTATLLASIALLAGCSRQEEERRPSAVERAQEKLEHAMEKSKDGARKVVAEVRERWDELRPELEKALKSLDGRVERLVDDLESRERLPARALEKIRERLERMRELLAEAKDAHERGDMDLAVEKAEAARHEQDAVEELLVERPDPPTRHAD